VVTIQRIEASYIRHRELQSAKLLQKMNTDASYVCGACGEEIVVPIDLSQGERQEYVEDCPVCCRANVIVVEIDEDGEARAWAELE
jgi:hypothetical protein